MTGPDRAMLYRLALETGLRWSELASLKRRSFDLKAKPPSVTVEASHSKHRRQDTLPLRKETARALEEYLADKLPLADALPMPKGKVGAKMLREDLAVAEVPYRDAGGRVVDFHALRHSFITNLANSGVHPSTAQRLARHSDVNLTLSRYTHMTLDTQGEAVEQLPDIAAETEVAEATGTEGAVVLGSCLATQVRPKATHPDQSGQHRGGSGIGRGKRKPLQTKGKGGSDGARSLVPPQGLEPWTHGLRIRCSA